MVFANSCPAGGGRPQSQRLLAACLLLWRQPMAREAFIAISTALVAVGTYRLLDLLGAVLVGGP